MSPNRSAQQIRTFRYGPNGSYTVAGPGSLTLGSSPFFYWNTKADGTGTILGPGAATGVGSPLLHPDVPELRRETLEDGMDVCCIVTTRG
jgi:hypothetical protein